MKKAMVIGMSLMLVLALAGCGATHLSSDTSGQGAHETVRLDDSHADALPVVVQLVIGTFELEGSELAVDAEQAGELLPLWKAARSLAASDTAAEQEVAAVVDQIQETMGPEQVSAIADMALKRANMLTVMEEIGIQFGDGGAGREGTGGGQREGFPGGGLPGGGFPGSGAPGQEISPEMRATMEARRASGEMRLPPAMFDALIKLLEEKAG